MTLHRRGTPWPALLLALLLCAASSAAATAEQSRPQPRPQPRLENLAETVKRDIDSILDRLQERDDFNEAKQMLELLFDAAIAYVPDSDRETFRAIAIPLRLVDQLAPLDRSLRLSMLAFLREHPRLAAQLAFAVNRDVQKPEDVYALLERLRAYRSDLLESHAALVTAICIVHDRPLVRRINENRVTAPDPLAVFEYFIANEDRMLHGLRDMPVELLKHVVDVTVSIEELHWAARRYRNDQVVGKRFFDVPYDFNHYRRGTVKGVTQHGLTLPNCLQYGGVCADQAHFATSVGKSIGVPTTYVRGSGPNSGHAWVGFLQARNRRVWWNFDIGRYEAYQRVRGSVIDPQTRRSVPDNFIGLTAELVHTGEVERQQAAALCDAALRLRELAKSDGLKRFEPVDDTRQKLVRDASPASQLALIEAGLRVSPGYAPGWLIIRDMAVDNDLNFEQKQYWSGVLHRMCGEHYPDFHLAILKPMIQSVADVRAQASMWEEASKLFRGRDDLVAELIMAEGEMWEKAGDPVRAGRCYELVVERYANSGPFILQALRQAESILTSNNREDLVPQLYENAWSRIRRPRDLNSPYMRQSNYVRVGMILAQRHERAGNTARAAAVRRMLPE